MSITSETTITSETGARWSGRWFTAFGETYESAPMATVDDAIDQTTLLLSTYELPAPVDGLVNIVNSETGATIAIATVNSETGEVNNSETAETAWLRWRALSDRIAIDLAIATASRRIASAYGAN